jgi:hypothetical protein
MMARITATSLAVTVLTTSFLSEVKYIKLPLRPSLNDPIIALRCKLPSSGSTNEAAYCVGVIWKSSRKA